ncbi:MAG TPA: twin transmembrane helix small protein [Gammaproteobacteria bacterium]|nr:twin transmembrane helix small protein [Gammaproteobacteria bacterium]
MKLIIVLIFAGILAALFSGMFFMIRDKGDSTRNVKSLSIRIGLSLALFALLIILYLTGVIHPNAVTP